MWTRAARDLKVGGLALAIMVLFAALHLLGADLAPLRRLELTALDLRLRLLGPQPPGSETVIVQVDERSLGQYGRWPLPRTRYAELVRRLQDAGARVIVFDLLFAEPETPFPGAPEGFAAEIAALLAQQGRTDLTKQFDRVAGGDAALAQAMREAGNVALPFSFRADDGVPTRAGPSLANAAFVRVQASDQSAIAPPQPGVLAAPIKPLADAAAALGFSLVAYDVDGAPRHERLALEHDLDHYPSLALRAVQLYRGVAWRDVRLELGRGVAIGAQWVPTDRLARRMIRTLGPRGSFRTESIDRVLAGAVPAETFKDHIIVVGANIPGISETFETPFSAVMPGIERLATVIDNLLHDGFIRRPPAMAAIEAATLLVLALLIGLGVSRFSVLPAVLVAAVLTLAVAIAGYLALKLGNLWVMATLPLTAMPVVFAAALIYRHLLLDREHRRAQRAFARYLAPDMVERLTQSRTPPALGGELRELTVLFCDIRGFAALSEKLSPQELTQLVNAFFSAVTDAILAHGGTVDKYIGDGVMAFWNAPLAQPDHAERACRAALDMLDRVAALNRERPAEAAPLMVGIGVNTGPCVVGNFGSHHRFDYSAVGDAVNVAARLEVETKQFDLPLLIGPGTAARVPALLPQLIGHVQLRGRTAPIEVFALRRSAPRANGS